MNRFTFSLIPLLLFIGVPTFAQKNYQPAIVIKNNGDTLEGYIDYREWYVNPNQIQFKTKDKKNVEKYRPQDIQAFMVGGDLYKSKSVDVERISNLQTFATVVYYTNPVVNDSLVFLRTLSQGKAHLYSLVHSGGLTSYYLQKDTAKPALLVYRNIPYLIEKDNSANASEPNKAGNIKDVRSVKKDTLITQSLLFRQQIAQILSEFPPRPSDIKNLPYRAQSISKLVNDYNRYFSNDYKTNVINSSLDRLKIKFGVNAGYISSTLGVVVNGSFSNDIFNLKGNGYGVGATVQYILPRMRKKWSIVNDLVFSSIQLKGYEETTLNNLTITTSEFDISNFRIYTQVRYRVLSLNNWDLFVNAGIFHSFLIKAENSFSQTSPDFPSSNRSGVIIKEEVLRPVKYGIVAGLGVKLNGKFQLESRIDRQSGLSQAIGISSLLTNFRIMGTYFF